jgi:hypothetical protein
MQPISRETIVERRQPSLRWSSVFAGSVFAIAVWILLESLGAGLGLAVIDTDKAGNLRGVGIGTGIWSLLCPLIAIFCGGLVVGRMSSARDRTGAAIHGAVMWALTTLIGLWAVVGVITSLASGAARVGGAAAGAAGNVVSTAVQAGGTVDAGKLMQKLGVSSNDLVGPINQRLQRDGKPPITADQLGEALKGVAQRGIREGRLDHQVVVEEVSRTTSLSQADAEDIANEISHRFDQAATDLQQTASQVGESAKGVALQVASTAGQGLLYAGIMLLLGLVVAVLGAALTARRYVAAAATTTTTAYPPTAYPPGTTPPGTYPPGTLPPRPVP